MMGALRCLPTFLLTSLSALEHLGEPPSSLPFRALRAAALASLVRCDALHQASGWRDSCTRSRI